MVVARARDLTDVRLHLELTVKMDTQVADCAGTLNDRAAYGKSAVLLWYADAAVMLWITHITGQVLYTTLKCHQLAQNKDSNCSSKYYPH